MIKKGLKVGDLFTDGGRQYKVTAVLKNGNYISSAVEVEEPGMDDAETVLVEEEKEEESSEVPETQSEEEPKAKTTKKK